MALLGLDSRGKCLILLCRSFASWMSTPLTYGFQMWKNMNLFGDKVGCGDRVTPDFSLKTTAAKGKLTEDARGHPWLTHSAEVYGNSSVPDHTGDNHSHCLEGIKLLWRWHTWNSHHAVWGLGTRPSLQHLFLFLHIKPWVDPVDSTFKICPASKAFTPVESESSSSFAWPLQKLFPHCPPSNVASQCFSFSSVAGEL